MIIAALAKKLGFGVLLEELFEFAFHRARTMEISLISIAAHDSSSSD